MFWITSPLSYRSSVFRCNSLWKCSKQSRAERCEGRRPSLPTSSLSLREGEAIKCKPQHPGSSVSTGSCPGTNLLSLVFGWWLKESLWQRDVEPGNQQSGRRDKELHRLNPQATGEPSLSLALMTFSEANLVLTLILSLLLLWFLKNHLLAFKNPEEHKRKAKVGHLQCSCAFLKSQGTFICCIRGESQIGHSPRMSGGTQMRP